MKNKKYLNYNVLIKLTAIFVIAMCIGIIIIFKFINKSNIDKIFNKYNLNMEETVTIYEIEKENDIYIVLTILAIIFISGMYIILTYFAKRKLNNQLKEISNIVIHIKEIKNQNILNQVDTNLLGSMKNEIFQTVKRLHEYTDNLNKDRKLLSEYLSDIAHQLRTPLLSMSISTDILLQSDELQLIKDRNMICNISNQLDQMQWLVDNLLKMAQLDTKAITLKKDRISMHKLINTVIQNVEILLEIYNREITVMLDNNISYIGDFKWNVEAITNIVKNSIEHSKKRILIKCKDNALYTEIIIEDDGNGIKEEELIHVFDRFYKGKNSDKDSFGIGLALSKKIIEYQQGNILVESEINKGTKFLIRYYK